MNKLIDTRLGIKRRVLIVDDELVNRKILAKILGSDYEILNAANGQQALDILRSDEQSISLILLDLLMPNMDGYEFMSIVSEDESLKRIPIIVLTSERLAEVKSLRMGAVDFIPKPYNMPEVILARVQRSIELSEDRSLIDATQYDSLTGLFNRDYFLRYTQIHDQYYPNTEMDAIALDINRFHLVNEMHGRRFANELLCKMAERIREYAREQHGIACRVGSDLFFMYVPHTENPQEILDYIGRGVMNMIEASRLRMGIYQRVNQNLDPDHRFDCALLACNSIRSNYKMQISTYDRVMHERETYSERLIGDIDTALSEKHFKVYFQPKFNIKGERAVLASAEALIRWMHPELGMVRPDNFIPLFEGNGLVQKLDHFVWHEAAAQIRRWRDKFGITVPVSVNVSRIDMMEPTFIEEMKQLIADNGLKPEDYYLELTETAYTDNSEQIISIVNTLREYGFRVEMDDFGSGYSSLNMLSNLPIDVLKLDMKFVQNIHTSNRDYRMLELVMDIARFLNVIVVAEGVEYEEQYKLLKKLGCDVIQGYYFSRPLPPEEFEKYIEEKVRYLKEQGSR